MRKKGGFFLAEQPALRRLIVAGALVAAALAAVLPAPEAGAFENVREGDEIPAFSLPDTGGATISYADLKGKALVVVFFREGPNTKNALKRVGRSAKANAEKNAAYLGIYLGHGDAAAAKALEEESGAVFPILLGGEEIYAAFGIKALPSTGIFDPAGKLVHEIHLASFDLEMETSEYLLVALGEKTAQDAEMMLHPQDAAPLSAEEEEAKKLFGLAQILMERGMKEKAVEKLHKILEIDPGFCDAHILLGHTYLDEDKVEEAIGEFTYVIKCDPTSNDAKLGLGMAHARKGELEKAEEYLKGALALNPMPERVYYELGKLYETKGDLPGAVESYKHALKRLLGAQ